MSSRIVVIGGGYAGLSFLQHLVRLAPDASVTLIDRNDHHTVLTEVHEVAAGRRDPSTLSIPFSSLHGIRFLQAKATGLDPEQRLVLTTAGAIGYDLLVLAPGSVDADFGIPGVRKHALMLHSLKDALAIRRRVELLPDTGAIIVVGGGLTGVELAAELSITRAYKGSVTVIEAASALLPGMPGKLQRAARRQLGSLGANVLTGARVQGVTPSMVSLDDGTTLPYDLVVWACGVRANPLIASLGLPVDRTGRALVDQEMRTPLPDVYVIGDAAAGAPATAQAAAQQGPALAGHIAARLDGREQAVTPVRELGTLVSVGARFGVGTIGPFALAGRLPSLAKHLNVARWVYRVLGGGAALRYFLGLEGHPLSVDTRTGTSSG